MIITEISCCKVPSTIPMSDNAWETAWVYARINPPVPSFVPPKYRVTTAATLISWFLRTSTSVCPPFHLVLHHRCFAGFHFSPMMKALQLWFAFQCSFYFLNETFASSSDSIRLREQIKRDFDLDLTLSIFFYCTIALDHLVTSFSFSLFSINKVLGCFNTVTVAQLL